MAAGAGIEGPSTGIFPVAGGGGVVGNTLINDGTARHLVYVNSGVLGETPSSGGTEAHQYVAPSTCCSVTSGFGSN